jgi:very-short-patch-repair endonuclease
LTGIPIGRELPGSGALAGAAGPQLARSEAERRMLGLLAAAQLPRPEVNARLEGLEVDFLWRAQKLIVEVDGYSFHADRAAFECDRRRDQMLLAARYRALRVTWRQLLEEPIALAVRIGQALSALAVAS